MASIKVGDLCLTPFEPRGEVRVRRIFPSEWAGHAYYVVVEYLHDHAGYSAGELGGYFADELILLDAGE